MPRHLAYNFLRAAAALSLGGALLYTPRRPAPFRPPDNAVWATDIAPTSPGWLQVGLKATGPLPRQKRPPCTPVRERELVGACWIGTEHRPPCPEAVYEVASRCVLPVGVATREPTSLGR